MRKIVVLLLLVCSQAKAQNNIAHFSFWQPMPGQEELFETGYKKHLVWHKENGDQWGWYGWYFISGARAGQFFDATFDHSWADYDKPVNPAGDGADNALHTEPFADYLAGMKMMKLSQLCIGDHNSLKKKLLRYITIDHNDLNNTLKIVEKLKTAYASAGINSFFTFKPVDGTSLNQLILFIGADNWEKFGKTGDLQEKISVFELELKTKSITSITSETLLYRADMSLFP